MASADKGPPTTCEPVVGGVIMYRMTPLLASNTAFLAFLIVHRVFPSKRCHTASCSDLYSWCEGRMASPRAETPFLLRLASSFRQPQQSISFAISNSISHHRPAAWCHIYSSFCLEGTHMVWSAYDRTRVPPSTGGRALRCVHHPVGSTYGPIVPSPCWFLPICPGTSTIQGSGHSIPPR